MSQGVEHVATPDDPNARAIIHAYEDTVMSEGAHASYEKHFSPDAFYVFYGNSPVAGRYEGIDGLKRFWDTITALADPIPSPVIELAGGGFLMYHVQVDFTAPSGETFTTKIAGNYEVEGDKILSGRFWAFDQDDLDAFLRRARAWLDRNAS